MMRQEPCTAWRITSGLLKRSVAACLSGLVDEVLRGVKSKGWRQPKSGGTNTRIALSARAAQEVVMPADVGAKMRESKLSRDKRGPGGTAR